jgi:hypothetical protein
MTSKIPRTLHYAFSSFGSHTALLERRSLFLTYVGWIRFAVSNTHLTFHRLDASLKHLIIYHRARRKERTTPLCQRRRNVKGTTFYHAVCSVTNEDYSYLSLAYGLDTSMIRTKTNEDCSIPSPNLPRGLLAVRIVRQDQELPRTTTPLMEPMLILSPANLPGGLSQQSGQLHCLYSPSRFKGAWEMLQEKRPSSVLR